ncbi:MAG: carboxypeptidase regulatory-like domain-containing protein [Chitinophagaceae bacterium]|nr:MAG: carboxypeptidase regulatory-like domain-containing protein [Chitinophagaceae bacterium]
MKRSTFLLHRHNEHWRERLRQLLQHLLPAAPREVLLSGRVCNADGDPVAFARVEAGGTPYHTEANAAGCFALHVPEVQFRNPFSLFVYADGFARFERRIEAAPGEALECVLTPGTQAKVVRLGAAR